MVSSSNSTENGSDNKAGIATDNTSRAFMEDEIIEAQVAPEARLDIEEVSKIEVGEIKPQKTAASQKKPAVKAQKVSNKETKKEGKIAGLFKPWWRKDGKKPEAKSQAHAHAKDAKAKKLKGAELKPLDPGSKQAAAEALDAAAKGELAVSAQVVEKRPTRWPALNKLEKGYTEMVTLMHTVRTEMEEQGARQERLLQVMENLPQEKLLDAVERIPGAVSGVPEIGRQQVQMLEAIKEHMDRQTAASEQQNAANQRQAEAIEKQNALSERQAAAIEKQNAATERQAAAMELQKSANDRQVVAIERQAAAIEKQSASGEQLSTALVGLARTTERQEQTMTNISENMALQQQTTSNILDSFTCINGNLSKLSGATEANTGALQNLLKDSRENGTAVNELFNRNQRQMAMMSVVSWTLGILALTVAGFVAVNIGNNIQQTASKEPAPAQQNEPAENIAPKEITPSGTAITARED